MENKIQLIKKHCLSSTTSNPIEILLSIMNDETIPMHGPVHHLIDGACFLTALHNAGVTFDLEKALDEMMVRGQKMPGATCGQWGVCGSVPSLGAALSIVHETGPLSHDQYYKDHLSYTSLALSKMANIGGPRCCKRNSFISIQTAIDFVAEHYGIVLPKQEIHCDFSPKNQQCIGIRCPYFKGKCHE